MSRSQAETAIARYIDGFYNPVRRHSTLDFTSPVKFEAEAMQTVSGASTFPGWVHILLKNERLSPHYFLEVRREGRLDDLTVVVEAKAGAGDEATRAAAGQDLAGHIKSRIGITSTVTVMEPDAVERSMGKAQRIVDLRPKE